MEARCQNPVAGSVQETRATLSRARKAGDLVRVRDSLDGQGLPRVRVVGTTTPQLRGPRDTGAGVRPTRAKYIQCWTVLMVLARCRYSMRCMNELKLEIGHRSKIQIGTWNSVQNLEAGPVLRTS